MRVTEIIKLMPTQFRQPTENPLVAGHYIPLIGYWTEDTGYVKTGSLSYLGKSLACPIIAVVEEKLGGEDLELNITAKVSEYDSIDEKTQELYTIKRKEYVPTENTVSTTLTIPRHTRPWATFLLTGLGKDVYEISSITTDTIAEVGKVNFYALASNGSRIIYWLGLHFLSESLREILNGIWIAPTKCIRCSGTGIEPDTESTACRQCNGYRFSGYNATKWIQRQKGFDVGLAREILDWDNLTQADHTLIEKFINKAWTQKWWVTPTVHEIKRLFAHFYNIDEDYVKIEERYNPQEPVWRLSLPFDTGAASPFGTLTETDKDLLRFIARSVTPAGVNVFVGFYWGGDMGDLEDFDMSRFVKFLIDADSVAFGQEKGIWGMPRWADWNGWVEAVDHFENYHEDVYPATETFTFEENDQEPQNFTVVAPGTSYAKVIESSGGHGKVVECYFNGNAGEDYEVYLNNFVETGDNFAEVYVKMDDLSSINHFFVMAGDQGDACGWLLGDYLGGGSGLYNILGTFLYAMSLNTWYRIKITWDYSAETADLYIAEGEGEYTKVQTGLAWANGSQTSLDTFYFRSTQVYGAVEHTFWFDALGVPTLDSSYEAGDNRYAVDGSFVDESIWDAFENVEIVNVNDQSRNWLKFTNNAYIQMDISGIPTGQGELWLHPVDTAMRIGIYSSNGWNGYIEYNSNGFYDNNGNLLHTALPNNDFHLSLKFAVDAEDPTDSGNFAVATGYIDRGVKGTGFRFSSNMGINPKFRVESIGTGEGWIDAFGNSWNDVGYQIGDNWQRLHPSGFGLLNLDFSDGVSNLWEEYISKDKFWNV